MAAAPCAPVVVLGGGPAGSAVALSLKAHRPGLAVVIVEPGGETLRRLGESLSPAAREILGSLGCWPRFEAAGFLQSHGTLASWESAQLGENAYLFSARGLGWQVERESFDALLVECAMAAGVAVLRGARYLGSERGSDGLWRLFLRGTEPLDASFVVDATGRAAVFATAQGARRLAADRLAGALRMFRLDGDTGGETLVEAEEEGWWYSVPTRGGLLAVGWMSDPDLLRLRRLYHPESWLDHVRRSHYTSLRIADAQPACAVTVRAAGSQCLDTVVGGGWLATGDSAAAYDPLSGQGLLHALRFGKLASFAILDYLQGRAQGLQLYRELIHEDYDAYLHINQQYYAKVTRWPNSPFWMRRASCTWSVPLPKHFDDAFAVRPPEDREAANSSDMIG